MWKQNKKIFISGFEDPRFFFYRMKKFNFVIKIFFFPFYIFVFFYQNPVVFVQILIKKNDFSFIFVFF